MKNGIYCDCSGSSPPPASYWTAPKIAMFTQYNLSGLGTAVESGNSLDCSEPNDGGHPFILAYTAASGNWTVEFLVSVQHTSGNYIGNYISVVSESLNATFEVGLINNQVNQYRHKITGGITSGTNVETMGSGFNNAPFSPQACYSGWPFAVKISFDGTNIIWTYDVIGDHNYISWYSVALATIFPSLPTDIKPAISLSNSSGLTNRMLIQGIKVS